MITVAPFAMVTLLLIVGTIPPTHVVAELQSPPPTLEVITLAAVEA